MKGITSIALLALLLAGSLFRNAVWDTEGGIWEDTIRKSPRKARAYNELGLHELNAGRNEYAYRLLSRSLELNPYQGEVYVNLALALEHLDRIDEAIKVYEQAISFQPDDPTPYYNLGVLAYRVRHDRNRALTYFLQARDRNPEEPDVHHFLSRIYAEKGEENRSREEETLYRQLKP
ncbi:MAG: tetratricopeptide repeat protein [Nitrospiraceae bacterium]|nr:tetratricopeptide repeat protein [Nitrospiraceae bacterium]